MSHQILQEQIDELRKKVNDVISEGVQSLKNQGLVDDATHVTNEFIGSLDDAFSDAFYQDLSRLENEEMMGEQYKRDAYRFDNGDRN